MHTPEWAARQFKREENGLLEPAPTRFAWRHQYDDDADREERERTDIHNTEPSLTQQHFAHDADLNVIVKRMGVTDGSLPGFEALKAMPPHLFGDFSEAQDLRTSLDIARSVSDAFQAMPAAIRNRFRNDPVAMHEFLADPANIDEAIQLGLAVKQTPEPPLGSKERPIFTAAPEPPAPKTP